MTLSPAPLACFKSYDVRGRIGADLDAPKAFAIGRAFARVTGARRVVTGHDCRPTSPAFRNAVAAGLMSEGAAVLDIGPCGTEEVYFATTHLHADGGIMVTASHNPITDNGMKFVQAASTPLDQATFQAIGRMATGLVDDADVPAVDLVRHDTRPEYAAMIAAQVEAAKLPPVRIVVNAGHGMAGPAFDAIVAQLHAAGAALDIVRINHAPDSEFPKGIPNPLLPANRAATADAVRDAQADLGIAWDGDFDRCFFFDQDGTFIDGEYIVGLLAAACLRTHPGAMIVHDPRVIWNTTDQIAQHGGMACLSQTGHVHIKRKMRETDAVYGGEMSAHHYFRDFMYCDSGMLPWLKILELLGHSGRSLGALVADMRARYPSSGELNFTLSDADAAKQRVFDALSSHAISWDQFDGLSMVFDAWRLNLRSSATEPVIRLNVETRGDRTLLISKTAAVVALLEGSDPVTEIGLHNTGD